MEVGELSPWMPRPFLGFLPERPRGSQGQDGLSGPSSPAIPQKPCPECSEKAGQVLSGAWSSMCPALRVTSSRRGLGLITHSGFGSLKGRMWERGVVEGTGPFPGRASPATPLEPSLPWICDSYHSFYIYRALPSVGDLMVKKSISVLVSDSARSRVSLEIQDGVGSMRLDHRMEEEAPAPCLCSGSPPRPPAAARSKSSRHN